MIIRVCIQPKPSPWGEGAPKGRMRGNELSLNPLIRQKSKIFASFPPGGSFWTLPRQYDKSLFMVVSQKPSFCKDGFLLKFP